MKAKINEKIICIPPYVSTSWDRISFMQTELDDEGEMTLVLHLDDGKCIKIVHLDKALIDLAFSAHLKYLESKSQKSSAKESPLGMLQSLFGPALPEQLEQLPIRLGIVGLPGIESVMQHNSAQKEAPDLPKDVLSKMGQITKMMMAGDLSSFPKPEPHCNCPHCQLARAAHGIEKEEGAESVVSEEDLTFRDWDIKQKSEKLYIVTNPLDTGEQYNVFLGEPVGCTCGNAHCEHIKAVLLN